MPAKISLVKAMVFPVVIYGRLVNTAENDPKRFLGETGQQNFPRASSPNMLNNSNILVGL